MALKLDSLQARIVDLENENRLLKEEVIRLTQKQFSPSSEKLKI